MTLNHEVQPGDWVVVDVSRGEHRAEATGQVWRTSDGQVMVGHLLIRNHLGSYTDLWPSVLRRCDPLPEPRPEGWPPTAGQIWADDQDHAWIAVMGDHVELMDADGRWWDPDDLARVCHGPLRLVLTPKATP